MAQNTWDAQLYDSKHNFVTNYGNSVVELLNPQPHETILDLGCGSGDLTANIATKTTKAVGIDFSYEMIARAKSNHVGIEFIQHNAEEVLPFDYQFDAIFSNAALHWMINANAVAKNMAQALKPNGRLVLEMGGKGNIETIIKAISSAANNYDIHNLPIFNFFPSIAEYSTILEQHGFKVTYAWLFERPTLLDGEDGLRNWIKMFRNDMFNLIPITEQENFLKLSEEFARAKLYQNNQWIADYVRLRMIAIKL